MKEIKVALDNGDAEGAIALTQDVKEIARVAKGSKRRIRTATRVFVLNPTSEGDAQIAKWSKQKNADAVMWELSNLAKDYEEADRFCCLLGDRLKELRFKAWSLCSDALLQMRDPRALGYFLDYFASSTSTNGALINKLGRARSLIHERDRVMSYLQLWEGSEDFDWQHYNWILAKLGNKAAYQELVELCLTGDTGTEATMRSAQAVANINNWDFFWGKEDTEKIRARLQALN